MENNKRIPLVIFLSIIALLMVGTSIYMLVTKESTPTENTKNSDTITGTLTTPITGDKINYTLPTGWKQEYSSERDEYSLTSSDYIEGDTGVNNGVIMYLSVSGIQDGQTLETEKANLKQGAGFTDISNIVISNLSGIKYHSDWDGGVHSIQYFTINGQYNLLVSAFTRDLTAEQSYITQIESVINSISFK